MTKLDTHRIALVSHEQKQSDFFEYRREKQHLEKNSRIQELEVRKLKIVKKKESPVRINLDFCQTMEKHYSVLRIFVSSSGSFSAFGILEFWDNGILEH